MLSTHRLRKRSHCGSVELRGWLTAAVLRDLDQAWTLKTAEEDEKHTVQRSKLEPMATLFPLVRGEIFGTRVSCEARSAELSRYKFVCRWRYPGGTGEEQLGAQGRAFEVQVCLSVAMSGGTGEEQCGAQGRAFEVQVCLSVAIPGRDWWRAIGRAGPSFRGTSLFVGGDVGRDWWRAMWRAGPSFRGTSLFVGGSFRAIFVWTSRESGGKLRHFYKV